jgi:hypothetical protein
LEHFERSRYVFEQVQRRPRSQACTELIGFWFCAVIIYIPKSPISQYLVLNLRQLGFSRFESNVLTMPSDFLRVITVLTLTRSSGHLREKAFHCTIPTFIAIPLFTTLLFLPPHGYAWVRFAILTMIIGTPSSHPIMVSWISCNSFDPKKRGIAVALFGTIHEIGSVAAARKWNLTYTQAITLTWAIRDLQRRRQAILLHWQQGPYIDMYGICSGHPGT